MLAWQNPQAAVAKIGIFECKPESSYALRLSQQERSILVPRDLSPNTRLLKDQHGLDDERIVKSQELCQRNQARVV